MGCAPSTNDHNNVSHPSNTDTPTRMNPRLFMSSGENDSKQYSKNFYQNVASFNQNGLITLEQACKGLQVNGLQQLVQKAKKNATHPKQGLTQDEHAAIFLYTQDSPFYQQLNESLRQNDERALTAWYGYLQLFLNALHKLPMYHGTVWRGIPHNLKMQYKKDDERVWWGFNLFEKKEKLDGQIYCDSCEQIAGGYQKTSLGSLSPIIIVQLKRFPFDGTHRKVMTTVDYPLNDFDFYRSNQRKSEDLYDLLAMSMHAGSLASGHYTACVRHIGTNEWYYVNDNHYERITDLQIIYSNPKAVSLIMGCAPSTNDHNNVSHPSNTDTPTRMNPRLFMSSGENDSKQYSKNFYQNVASFNQNGVITLEQACKGLQVNGLQQLIQKAKKNATHPKQGLTQDEHAAIFLYTQDSPFYQQLNESLRQNNERALTAWYGYLQLFLNALHKLPMYHGTVWRGIPHNLKMQYKKDDER
ncbi:unnamed protein product, partial [Adineta ricciae]